MIVTDINISREIRKVADLAKLLDIDRHHFSFNSINVSSGLKKLCKSTLYYREVYDYITAHNEYNLMLKDNACFQFSESRNNSNEQELRYAYYPNPYQFVEFKDHVKAAQELLDQGSITQSDYEQLLNECHFTHHIPVIRYDYSPSQYHADFHPASHFHIGFNGENRWPVGKVLTPYLFFLKILSMYYSDIWTKNFTTSVDKTLNDIYSEAKRNSYAVPSCYFTNEDIKRLILT